MVPPITSARSVVMLLLLLRTYWLLILRVELFPTSLLLRLHEVLLLSGLLEFFVWVYIKSIVLAHRCLIGIKVWIIDSEYSVWLYGRLLEFLRSFFTLNAFIPLFIHEQGDIKLPTATLDPGVSCKASTHLELLSGWLLHGPMALIADAKLTEALVH